MSRFLLDVALLAAAGTVAGYWLLFLNLHGGGLGLWLALALVPGVWLGTELATTSGPLFWALVGVAQVAYWAAVLGVLTVLFRWLNGQMERVRGRS